MAGNGTMQHLIAAALAVFAGSIVEGILGFGCSLVWMSFFPLFTTVPDAVGVLQPMHIALNLILLASIWNQCTPNELKPLAITVPFGIVFGLWIVTSWSSDAIDCVLGIFLIVYTFLDNDEGEGHTDHKSEDAVDKNPKELLRKSSSKLELDPLDEMKFGEEKKDDNYTQSPIIEEMPHQILEMSPLIHRHPLHTLEGGVEIPNLSKNHNHSKPAPKGHTPATSKPNTDHSSSTPDMLRNPTAICAGLVGGALMGAFGTGGPAFLIYAKEAGWQKRPELFRANLQMLFFVINAVCCFSQFAEGIITYERCKVSLWLSPALLAGGQVGRILAQKVPKDKFQILVVNGLRIMGLMFLIEATR